jgi:hypothetical protein
MADAAAPPSPVAEPAAPAAGSGASAALYTIEEAVPRGPDNARALNRDAVVTLSSARLGHGVDALLSDDAARFWQSDGTAPHWLTVQFYRRESVWELALRWGRPVGCAASRPYARRPA